MLTNTRTHPVLLSTSCGAFDLTNAHVHMKRSSTVRKPLKSKSADYTPHTHIHTSHTHIHTYIHPSIFITTASTTPLSPLSLSLSYTYVHKHTHTYTTHLVPFSPRQSFSKSSKRERDGVSQNPARKREKEVFKIQQERERCDGVCCWVGHATERATRRRRRRRRRTVFQVW